MNSFSLIDSSAATASGADSELIGGNYDAVLIAAQAGADWAWAMLYRSTAPALLKFLQAGSNDHAEDLLGEIFVEAARGVRTFGGDEQALRSWLLGIAYRRMSEARPRRNAPAMPAIAAKTVFAALQGAPAIPDPLERAHVAAAVRACVSGSPAPAAAPPLFRQLRPVAKYGPASVAGVGALAALVTAKTLAASALVLVVAAGGVAATAPDLAAVSAPPAAAQPALEAASAKAGFTVPARDEARSRRSAGAGAGDKTSKKGRSESAAEAVSRRSVQAHAAAAEHRAEGQARAAEARATRGPKTWTTQPGSSSQLPKQAAAPDHRAPVKQAVDATVRAKAKGRPPAAPASSARAQHAGRPAFHPRR